MEKPPNFRHGYFGPSDQVIENAEFSKQDVEKHLDAIAQEVFVIERKSGEGNFGIVYKDYENGICYKKHIPGREQKNSAKGEGEFLEELYDLSDEVIVPTPIAWSVAYFRDDKNIVHKREMLAMKYINGVRIKDILDPDKGMERASFPSTFDADSFFPALKRFINKMHDEKLIYHRDIADRNLMVDIKTGKPVVYDFGDAVYFTPLEHDAETGQDAYGRHYYPGVVHIDEDVKRVDEIEERVRLYLTNNK